MAIKPKIGQCVDCVENAEPGVDVEDKPLMAKRCFTYPHFHYQKHQSAKYLQRSTDRKKVKDSDTKDSNNGISIGVWFNQQINIMPKYCENCNDYLNPYAPWSARAYIAHIVPKRHFKSVMVHPMNRMFLCIDCHTKFDNSLSREIVLMRCWPIAVERFNLFVMCIDQSELRHLQPCFESLTNNK